MEKLVSLTYRVRCGSERLAELGLKIGTSFLERLNLTIRQSLSPLKRKTLGYSKERENLKKQTVFFQAFYNFAVRILVSGKESLIRMNVFKKNGLKKLQGWQPE